MKIQVKAVACKKPKLPKYQSEGASGADVFACLDEPLIIHSGETKAVDTGLMIAVPLGYEAQIRPRSGLALKHGIGIINSPGTIDSDYRGEVKVLLTNFGRENYIVNNGDRIAQMVITPIVRAEFEFANQLAGTDRGAGGFGHTGINDEG